MAARRERSRALERSLTSGHERDRERSRAALERSYESFNADLSARCAHMSARSARALLVLLLPINRLIDCTFAAQRARRYAKLSLASGCNRSLCHVLLWNVNYYEVTA